ncbi:MAG TPA: hypothetical protein PKH77_00550 [Anaerolineae bacterium]|nr:hypothetical protein [Anaerolineae bacterium]
MVTNAAPTANHLGRPAEFGPRAPGLKGQHYVYLPDARRYINLLYVVEVRLPPTHAWGWGQGWLHLAGADAEPLSVDDAQVLAHALYPRTQNDQEVPRDEFHPDHCLHGI